MAIAASLRAPDTYRHSFSRNFLRPIGAALVLALIAGVACSKKEAPEAHVRARIAAAVHAAESGDTAALLDVISSHYADNDGRDRRALDGLLRLYLLRHRPIYLYTYVPTVELLADDRARAVVYAAMAGHRIDAPAELARLSASLYRFDLELELEQSTWRVRAAAWRPAELSEFH